MSIFKRGETWYADITVPGRERFRGSLGTDDKQTAQRLHDEIRAKLHQRKAAGHTWYEAIQAWLQAAERNKRDRMALLKYDPGDIPLEEITAESFKIHHHTAGTYKRYANLFKAVLNVAVERGWLAAVPKFPKRKPPPDRLRWITQAEWHTLYTELPEHLKAPALFAVSTGLRQANVLGMEWSRIDMERRVAWITASEMKAKSHHGIPLSDDAMLALSHVKGQHKRWCFTYEGERMATIGAAWEKALVRAGLTDFRWHDLRHTWASWHVQAGTSLVQLQQLGGWKELSMVVKYGHLAPDHLREAANNAPKLYTS